MEKTNKIFLIIIIVCTILVIGLCAYAIITHEEEEISDAMKFKTEYESLNDKSVNDQEYMKLTIDEDNPIIYKTGKEILDVLDSEDAIIYFGFAACPWCRNLVPTLLETAKNKNIETIYYVDILDIRDSYEFDGSIKPKKIKDGTDAYYDILDFFGENLEKFFITDESGNKYDTGVTRLYAPTVVAVKDGEVASMHVATVESQEDPYKELNREQKEELEEILVKLFESIEEESCQEEGC